VTRQKKIEEAADWGAYSSLLWSAVHSPSDALACWASFNQVCAISNSRALFLHERTDSTRSRLASILHPARADEPTHREMATLAANEKKKAPTPSVDLPKRGTFGLRG